MVGERILDVVVEPEQPVEPTDLDRTDYRSCLVDDDAKGADSGELMLGLSRAVYQGREGCRPQEGHPGQIEDQRPVAEPAKSIGDDIPEKGRGRVVKFSSHYDDDGVGTLGDADRA